MALLNRLSGPLWGSWLHKVTAATLRADLLAGMLGALLVLPQAFAFASLAGLPPQYGLYTAIVSCSVAALFGSSWHVMSGPTNATSLALAASLAPLALVGSAGYIELALVVTVIVGVMQLLIGGLGLGGVANFISPATLRGFMSGAALLIVFHALPDLLGLPAPPSHGLPALLAHVAAQWPAAGLAAPAVGLLTVAVALALKRSGTRWPQLLAALVVGTGAAALLNHQGLLHGQVAGLQPVAVVGAIPPIWPALHWPQADWRSLPDLVGISFALTIVALGQSISIAKAVAERSGQQISTNREFVGQGLSNVVGGFFQCYVSCGSLNRSVPNFEAGAKTPLAAVFASLLLLVLIAVSAPLLALIPRAAIAGLLLLIAWSLLDWPGWQRLWQASRSDFALAAATALATISIRIEMAILLGTMLSLVTYLYRTSRPAVRTMGFDTHAPGRHMVVLADAAAPLPECPQLKMLRMEGEVYFGAVPWVSEQLLELRKSSGAQRHLLVMAKSMNFIDPAGADLWRQEMAARRALGGDLYFHRPRPQVLQMWTRVGFVQTLGDDHVFPSKRAAIGGIFPRLDPTVCARCSVRLYEECQRLPLPGAAAP